MSYKIKYFYRTGDSFHSEDVEKLLEYEWEILDVAKEALRRIKEHYEWYKSIESGNIITPPVWYNVKTGSDVSIRHYLINIPLDKGEEVQFLCPWCGYFETLYGADIVSSKDESMNFRF